MTLKTTNSHVFFENISEHSFFCLNFHKNFTNLGLASKKVSGTFILTSSFLSLYFSFFCLFRIVFCFCIFKGGGGNPRKPHFWIRHWVAMVHYDLPIKVTSSLFPPSFIVALVEYCISQIVNKCCIKN